MATSDIDAPVNPATVQHDPREDFAASFLTTAKRIREKLVSDSEELYRTKDAASAAKLQAIVSKDQQEFETINAAINQLLNSRGADLARLARSGETPHNDDRHTGIGESKFTHKPGILGPRVIDGVPIVSRASAPRSFVTQTGASREAPTGEIKLNLQEYTDDVRMQISKSLQAVDRSLDHFRINASTLQLSGDRARFEPHEGEVLGKKFTPILIPPRSEHFTALAYDRSLISNIDSLIISDRDRFLSGPSKRLIHLFVDNARYHHAKLVQTWLARPGCRIKLHFIPVYCPHLDPIERLWGLMHKHVTHNRCHATFADFKAAVLSFLREEVPRKWHIYRDQVTDNFRIISPKDFRILT
jgi:transposase